MTQILTWATDCITKEVGKNRLMQACVIVVLILLHPLASLGDDVFPARSRGILERIESAHRTLRGMHDTIGGEQSDGFGLVSKICGRSLDLWSSDFGYSTHPNDSIRLRSDLLRKVKQMHREGVIITLSWHQCNPTLDEPCTFADGLQKGLSELEWTELLAVDSPLNKKWKDRLDCLADFLASLQTDGVPVLLRLYHEPNFPCFWWYHHDASRFKALWTQSRSHFIETRGLKNLLWVWSVSYQPKYWSRVSDYYPGDDVLDIVGLDIYPPAHDQAPDFERAWNTLKQIAPHKPLALTEISRLPSKTELHLRNWAYVVPWGKSMFFRDNSKEEIEAYCGRDSRAGPSR